MKVSKINFYIPTLTKYIFVEKSLKIHKINDLNNSHAQIALDSDVCYSLRLHIYFILFIEILFWKMNGSKMEKEEREKTPLQGEDESRRSSPP